MGLTKSLTQSGYSERSRVTGASFPLKMARSVSGVPAFIGKSRGGVAVPRCRRWFRVPMVLLGIENDLAVATILHADVLNCLMVLSLLHSVKNQGFCCVQFK